MRAWCTFDTADIDRDNTLSINELKMLLWVYENEEPNDHRVNAEMSNIDSDNDHTIDRIEWLNYLCRAQEEGTHGFNTKKKKMFEKVKLVIFSLLIIDLYSNKTKAAETLTAKQHVSKLIDTLNNDI